MRPSAGSGGARTASRAGGARTASRARTASGTRTASGARTASGTRRARRSSLSALCPRAALPSLSARTRLARTDLGTIDLREQRAGGRGEHSGEGDGQVKGLHGDFLGGRSDDRSEIVPCPATRFKVSGQEDGSRVAGFAPCALCRAWFSSEMRNHPVGSLAPGSGVLSFTNHEKEGDCGGVCSRGAAVGGLRSVEL